MRQDIEKHKQYRAPTATASAAFRGRGGALGAFEVFLAPKCIPPSLSAAFDLRMAFDPARNPSRACSSSHTGKFAVEGAVVRAACLVFAAGPNNRSPQAAAILINKIPERRCRIAA